MSDAMITPPVTPVPEEPSPSSKGGGHTWLAVAIFLAIVLALVVAWFAPGFAVHLEVGGDIFLNLLFMVVVPLIVTSVMSGVIGMGDVRKLGIPGLATVAYFLTTTTMAVIVGLVLANIIRPGVGTVEDDQRAAAQSDKDSAKERVRDSISRSAKVPPEEVVKLFPHLASEETPNIWAILKNLVQMLFTKNLIASAVNMDILPLIGFSILFAGVLTTLGGRVTELNQIIVQANEALMSLIMVIMYVAPLGIFCLVASRFGERALDGPEEMLRVFSQLSWYMGTVLLGLTTHVLVTLPLLYWFFVRKNPYVYMGKISQAILTAFSTASSSATLPITLDSVVNNAGVSRKSADFVIPLGATINMDGTALYEAAAALFIAQAFGIDLSFGEQIIVVITATLAAIGAAGIPEAGLVTMLIVLSAVGLPTEGVALIVTVDWLLDRFRTAVNVTGDAFGAAIIEPTLASRE